MHALILHMFSKILREKDRGGRREEEGDNVGVVLNLCPCQSRTASPPRALSPPRPPEGSRWIPAAPTAPPDSPETFS